MSGRLLRSETLSIAVIDESSKAGVEEHSHLLTYCQEFASRMAPGDIVLIGGLSRSGKSTLANNLRLAVLKRGCRVWVLSLDRWLKDFNCRLPGVLGRYDLTIMQEVIARHSTGVKGSQNLRLPEYHKLQRRTVITSESILIQSTDILIIEGTVALTLAPNIGHIHRVFVEIDEVVRKQRVIDEYLSRGKNFAAAEGIYNARQVDETPEVIRSMFSATRINISSLCIR